MSVIEVADAQWLLRSNPDTLMVDVLTEAEFEAAHIPGAIVALAVLVSVWWPPARFLAGLTGAGLTFAAVTNTCAMGMLLSRLPYNRPGRPVDIEASLARMTGAKK